MDNNMFRRLTALFCTILLLAASGSAAFADSFEFDRDNLPYTDDWDAYSYDEEYYSQLAGQGASINFYNWGEYISDGSDDLVDVIAEFEALTDIKVYYTNFATNEELYAKLKSGAASYDVIVPSDYMVARMIKEEMLAPLDYSNIPNVRYMNPAFMDPNYDPGSVYSLPYAWNTVGIIYNTSMVDEEPDSWSVLWDEQYAGQILMFNNSRDAFGVTLKYLGYSLNTEDPAQMREAAELLKEQKPLVQAYVMDQIFDKMENNEAAIATYYSGDALLIDNDNIAIAIPKEGTNKFVDACCIPAVAKNKLGAEMFINFLNEPPIAAQNTEYVGYGTANLAAYCLLDEEVRNDPILYPPQEILDNSEMYINLSDEANLMLDQLWTEVKASNKNILTWGILPVMTIAAIVIGKRQYRKNREKRHKYMIED
ncbi:MAG: spermidine/putrescine ABC transporter substrate-binding protein [Firmicutes bacterium]|nr:spermidine/putrescine ABC transporter substrate-binding protein [Bacillota bacterium]